MAIRLIATDMDGTFTGAHSEILPENAAAFREAHEAGILLCLCSGRGPRDISTLRPAIGAPLWYIGHNGSVIRTPEEKDIYCCPINEDTLRSVLPYVEGTGAMYVAHMLEHSYVMARGSYLSFAELVRQNLSRRRIRTEFIGSWADIPAEEMRGCMKIDAFKPTPEEGVQLRSETLQQGFPVTVTSSFVNNMEIVGPGVDKGSALRILCERLDIAPEEVMVFGDQKNDLPMLRVADWPVVMANGDEETKKAARIIAPPNAENGVAQVVRRVALGRG